MVPEFIGSSVSCNYVDPSKADNQSGTGSSFLNESWMNSGITCFFSFTVTFPSFYSAFAVLAFLEAIKASSPVKCRRLPLSGLTLWNHSSNILCRILTFTGLLCSSPFISPFSCLVPFHTLIYLSSPCLCPCCIPGTVPLSAVLSLVCLFAVGGIVGRKKELWEGGLEPGACRIQSSFQPRPRTMDRAQKVTPGAAGALLPV